MSDGREPTIRWEERILHTLETDTSSCCISSRQWHGTWAGLAAPGIGGSLVLAAGPNADALVARHQLMPSARILAGRTRRAGHGTNTQQIRSGWSQERRDSSHNRCGAARSNIEASRCCLSRWPLLVACPGGLSLWHLAVVRWLLPI